MFKRKPKFEVPHPGKLIGETLKELGVSQYRFAKESGIDRSVLSGIIAGRRGITAETAIRLSRAFNSDAQSWLNMQSLYDLANAEKAKAAEFAKIKPISELCVVAV